MTDQITYLLASCRALFELPIFIENEDDVETVANKYDGSVLPLCQHIVCWIHDNADCPMLTWSEVRRKYKLKQSSMAAIQHHMETTHHVQTTRDNGIVAFTNTYLDRMSAFTLIISCGITPAMIATFTPQWVISWAQAYAFGQKWHSSVSQRNAPRLLIAYKAYCEYWIRLICAEHNLLATKFNPQGSALMKNYGVMKHIPCDHAAIKQMANELRFYHTLASIQEQAGGVTWRSDHEQAVFWEVSRSPLPTTEDDYVKPIKITYQTYVCEHWRHGDESLEAFPDRCGLFVSPNCNLYSDELRYFENMLTRDIDVPYGIVETTDRSLRPDECGHIPGI